MRATLVDTFAGIVFFTVVPGLLELWIVGLSPSQVFWARLTAVPVLLLTGRPYGLWRDFVMVRSGALRHGQVARFLADTAAFVSFQLPIYAGILLMVGASRADIVTGVATAFVAMLAVSRVYGLYLDLVRRLFGTLPTG
ncbi:MAG: L-alanine exporter AlaE [Pseudomonadota bacterium]